MKCGNSACVSHEVPGSEAFTYEMNADQRLVPQCLLCDWRGSPVSHDPGTLTNPFASETPARPSKVVPQVPQAKPGKALPEPKRKPINVLKEARARLRELKREIARLEKLKRERDQLTRLLAAAERDSGAVVPLRKAQ